MTGTQWFSREWTSVVATSVFITALIWLILSVSSKLYDALNAPMFNPMTIEKLHVVNQQVIAGETIIVQNGICNTTKQLQAPAVYLAIVRQGYDPITPDVTTAISGTPENGILVPVLPHSCTFEQDIPITIPANAASGLSVLYVELRTTGAHGEFQKINLTSNEFNVAIK